MFENFKDLNISSDDSINEVEGKIKEKLGIDFSTMKEALSSFVKEKAEELSLEFNNIAPYGDYGELLEDNEKMANFLKQEASLMKNWEISYFMQSDVNPSLLQFIFNNCSVDEGNSFQGHVFVSKSGKIRHAFAKLD
jgi:hypothetical protein